MVYPILGFIIGLGYFFLRFNYLYKNGHLESEKSITKYLDENGMYKTMLITILCYLFCNIILNLTGSEKHISVITDYIYTAELILFLMLVTGITISSIMTVSLAIVGMVLPLAFSGKELTLLYYYLVLSVFGFIGINSLTKLIYKDK